MEIAWEPEFGPDHLLGHYKVGIGYDTSGGYENYENALAAADVPGFSASAHRSALQAWALFDKMLVRNGAGASEGIIAIAGIASNNPSDTVYAQQYYAGLVDHDFWAARPKDSFGVLMMYYSISGRLGQVQDIE